MHVTYLEVYLAINDITKIIQAAVDAVKDKTVLDKIGEDLVERIKTRTRTGKGVREPEGRAHKLPDLKTKTKANRRSLKRSGKLTGKGAVPAKSGINRSGATLDSLKHTVSGDEIKIRLDSEGEMVAADLIKLNSDYTFMNISKPELKAVTEVLDKEIQKKIK